MSVYRHLPGKIHVGGVESQLLDDRVEDRRAVDDVDIGLDRCWTKSPRISIADLPADLTETNNWDWAWY